MQLHKLTPLLLLLFCLGQPLSAQLKVVDDNSVVVGTYNAPQASAKLEVNSETQGLLVPRWDFNQLAINEQTGMVTDGLLVYVQDLSDSKRGFWYWDNVQSMWLKLFGGCSTP